MARRIHNTAFTTGANSSEQQESVEGCSSQRRTTSSNDLSEREEDHNTSHRDNCAEKGAPAKFHTIIRKILNTVWAIFQIVKDSNPILATKIEQSSKPAQGLKPRQMNKMMRRLSSSFKSVRKSFAVGERWQEIQGCNGWANLLNPMDPGLRAEIYRYGEFAKATYDAFDRNTGCKYTEKELLKEVGLEDRGYEISDFLYTTAQLRLPKFISKFLDIKLKYSNWMGFVAVCTAPREIERLGRRDIVVAWRGTITLFEWIKDFQFWWKPVQFNPRKTSKGCTVESGFLSVYNSSNEESLCDKKSASHQVLGAVKELVEKYKKEDKQEDIKLSITVTGHSLGSALAILCAYDIAESSWINSQPQETSSFGSDSEGGIGSRPETGSGKSFPNDRIPITVYSFAGPRVGKRAFKSRIEELGVAVLRVVNKHDIVPKLPRMIFSSYEHVGQEFEINNLTCDYFEETKLQVVTKTENSESEPTEGIKTATTDHETAQGTTTETTTKAIIPTHAHMLEEHGRMLNLLRYLAEQHRLRGMLDILSPSCLRAYVNMLETLRRRRLLFRRRIRTSYLGAIFIKMLQGTASTTPHDPEDDIIHDDGVDGAVDGVRTQ